MKEMKIPRLDFESVAIQFSASSKRLLILDYDGTLTEIVGQPHQAAPSDAILDVLRELSELSDTHVYIVSGRDQTTLDHWIATHCPTIGLSAEHGSFLKLDGPGQNWIDLSSGIDFTWMDEISSILQGFCDQTPRSFLEKKKCAITWHFRESDPALGNQQIEACKDYFKKEVLLKFPVDLLEGKKNLEVRSKYLNKGEVVKTLISFYPGLDFVFCAGDDSTDEDMFTCLTRSQLSQKAITCVVGERKSAALNSLACPDETLLLLKKFCQAGARNFRH